MTWLSALALAATIFPFAFSMSATPGPNNVMLTAAAANFALPRLWPHMLGIAIGFPVMIVLVGLGLGGVFAASPTVHLVLKGVGAIYLVWLAFQIATARSSEASGREGRPLSFLQAAAFQWVNPKAWVIAAGGVATYTSVEGNLAAEILVISLVFALVSIPSSLIWIGVGAAAGRLLRDERQLRRFNQAMAALLVLSLVLLFL